jgi:hypothetical protein
MSKKVEKKEEKTPAAKGSPAKTEEPKKEEAKPQKAVAAAPKPEKKPKKKAFTRSTKLKATKLQDYVQLAKDADPAISWPAMMTDLLADTAASHGTSEHNQEQL